MSEYNYLFTNSQSKEYLNILYLYTFVNPKDLFETLGFAFLTAASGSHYYITI